MSSVTHPNGPEPKKTYWLRRVLVGAAALLALSLIWWMLSSLFSGGDDDAVTATPQNPTSLAVDPASSPTPTPSASSTPSSTPSGTPSTASASPSASSATPSSATPSSTPSSASPSPSGPQACQPSQLKLAVTGDAAPTIGKPTTLTVSATNTGDASCLIELARTPLSLQITSGADRIWSSAHCAKWAPTGTPLVPAGKAWTWSQAWTTQRSKAGCTLRTDALPAAGTYVATAQLDGQSARLVMMLHK